MSSITDNFINNWPADLEPILRPEPIKQKSILTNDQILLGKAIPAISHLKIMSEDDFEDMVLEWASGYLIDVLKLDYLVRKSSGAGDKGRDIMAFLPNGEWDNYQCKHYEHQLAPNEIWLELGKMCYYSYAGHFSSPRNYYFMTSQGVGPKLSELLINPELFKNGLIEQWNDKCKFKISAKQSIELDKGLLDYIESFDFSIIKSIEPLDLIRQHRQTPYYPARFGGGLLRPRGIPDSPPADLQKQETRYVEQLFEAYESHISLPVNSIDCLSEQSDLLDHFHRQRESFYWADSLEQFSRDSSGAGHDAFAQMKNEVCFAVIDTCNEDYSSGYARVKATTKHAGLLPKFTNPLSSVYVTQDVHGICHHLANENRLIWVKKR